MPAGEPTTAINPGALSSMRFLVSKRIEELDGAAARQEGRLTEVARRRAELRDRLEEIEVTWGHVVRNLSRFTTDDIEKAFNATAVARAELAVLEERGRDVGGRLTDIRAEQDVLRSVHRSLDELASANGTTPASSTARLRSASRQVFQVIEEERMRIARDMHDGPAQSMANLVLQAEILERLMARDPSLVSKELIDFKSGVRSVLDDTRRLIFDLRPMTLDDLGLVPTLRKFLKDYTDKTGIITHLRVSGEEGRLPGTFEPTLFRIIQEATNNVRKHASATSVEVSVSFSPRAVVAAVRDDGMGFDVAATEARLDATRNLGMISMRERADLEKGSLQIRSQVGKGTEIRAAFEW
ncbi:MAG: sensor histidine kinase [Candidatus Dormibacteria bacterium]